jgi:hypothetical protein
MNLFAIVQTLDREVRRIRTRQGLQRQLADEFHRQRDNFLGESETIEFDPRYKIDDDELFVVSDYGLPHFIENAIRNINQIDNLSLEATPRIKSIFATEFDPAARGELHVYFQGFMQRRLLVSGWTLLQSHDTYKRIEDPGLILDSSLVAVFKQGGSLYFRNFTLVSRFLDLTQYFVEATDDDIREVLSDDKFQIADEAAVLGTSDSIMRKRFMAVKASGVLGRVTMPELQSQAQDFGVAIRTNAGRIVFPNEKKEAKALLRLLLEGYYKGPLTGNKYMTNSQKRLEE